MYFSYPYFHNTETIYFSVTMICRYECYSILTNINGSHKSLKLREHLANLLDITRGRNIQKYSNSIKTITYKSTVCYFINVIFIFVDLVDHGKEKQATMALPVMKMTPRKP